MPAFLITGTSAGIGEQIALHLLKKPENRVIGVSRRNASSLIAKYDNYLHITGDLVEESTIRKIVDAVGSKLDGAVFNAGLLDSVSKIASTNMSEFKNVFNVNFFSVVSLTQALIPALRMAKGKAIYVSSGASVSGYQAWTAYGSSKAALNLMVATLAKEEPEITAVSVAPGVVDTPMQVLIREKTQEKQMSEVDMQKFLTLKKENKLVSPVDSGAMYAGLVLYASHDLSGQYLRYDDPKITIYYK